MYEPRIGGLDAGGDESRWKKTKRRRSIWNLRNLGILMPGIPEFTMVRVFGEKFEYSILFHMM